MVKIFWIPIIHLLELINGQTLFRYWFYVFYLSDEFMEFYFLPSIELHLLITWVCTCGALLSQKYRFIPLQMSSWNLTPKFLHRLMLRFINHVGRCTFVRRGTCGFLLSQRHLKQWLKLWFLNSQWC